MVEAAENAAIGPGERFNWYHEKQLTLDSQALPEQMIESSPVLRQRTHNLGNVA